VLCAVKYSFSLKSARNANSVGFVCVFVCSSSSSSSSNITSSSGIVVVIVVVIS